MLEEIWMLRVFISGPHATFDLCGTKEQVEVAMEDFTSPVGGEWWSASLWGMAVDRPTAIVRFRRCEVNGFVMSQYS
jgi:hypothetical protein